MKPIRLWVSGSRRARLANALVLGVLIAVATTVIVATHQDELPKGAALRVDDTVVTEDELDQRVKVLGALYGIERPADGPGLDDFNRDAAKAAAVSLVLDEAAEQRDIVVPEKTARDMLTDLVEKQYGPEGWRQFVQLLGREGASEHDVLEELARQRRIDQIFQSVTADAAEGVTEAVVREYFHSHPEEMVSPQQRRLRNVVVAAQVEAAEIARRARSGDPFATLVKHYSLDDSTRKSDGDLGLVSREMLETSYAKAAFRAAPGSVFGPVRTSHGWNVGLVVDVRPPRRLSFTEVRDSLRGMLVGEAAVEAWRDWLIDQLRDADIQYAADYRPENPLEPPGEAPQKPVFSSGSGASDAP